MKTQRKKHSRLWVYLLYLGLVTSLILSVTLARYASTAGGTGTATVAAMAGGGEILVQGQNIEMPLEGLLPGGEKTLEFQVVNYTGDAISEVAMEYDIKVETTGNLPLTFTLTTTETANGINAGTILADGTPLTGGLFPLTEEKQAHTYALTATWPPDKKDARYADEIDLVTVTVTARQKLSNEEESAGA